jgi:ABC-type Fe3+/spermidine/putrescine transport system ATPase subunit
VIGYQSVLFSIDELSLVSGNVYALFGANGTGKSTFLHKLALGGFQKNTVAFDEHEWEQYTVKQRTKLLTLIDNKFQGQHFLTTKEYLALGRFPYTGYFGGLSLNDEQIINQYSEELCLEHLFESSTATLSDGERQRASIAKALIQETPVLLFDEPLSNLDARLRRNMREEIRGLQQSLGLTVAYVTHDQSEALAVSDQIIVMDAGEIAQSGTPTDLYERPSSEFVAGFMGEAMLFPGTGQADGTVQLGPLVLRPRLAQPAGPVKVAVRPEAWRIARHAGPATLAARQGRMAYLGGVHEYTFETALGRVFVVSGDLDDVLSPGDDVHLTLGVHGVSVVGSTG